MYTSAVFSGLLRYPLETCQPFLQQPDGSVIKTTEMMALNIYNAFYSGGGNNRGVGQAKAVVFFILVAVIGLIQLQSTRKKEVQQ